MKRKAMLKAYYHFDTPRNLRCVDVSKVQKTLRPKPVIAYTQDSGINTETFKNYHFIVNGKKTIFKTYDGHFCDEIADFRALNEVLCYHIGKQIGVECSECEFAKYSPKDMGNLHSGTVSYDTLENSQVLVDAGIIRSCCTFAVRNTLESYETALKAYAERKRVNIDIDKIMFDLFKLCLFDYLTMQCDRHSSNVMFALGLDEKKIPTSLSLYPIIDNEYAFATFTLSKLLSDADGKRYFYPEEVLELYCKDCRRVTIRDDFAIYNDEQIMDNSREVFEIVEYAKQNGYMSFLLSALKNYDITKVIEELRVSGVKISANEQVWYEGCAKVQVDTMLEDIKKHEENKEMFEKLKVDDEVIFHFDDKILSYD